LIEFSQLGDVETLNKIETKLSVVDNSVLTETAQAQSQLNKNNGILFEYDTTLAPSVSMMIGVGGGVAARKWGGHWEFTEEEAEKLGVAVCQVIERYFPNMEPVNPLWNLAFVGGAIIAPKAIQTVMAPKKENQKNE
jgi:hypothetical protein